MNIIPDASNVARLLLYNDLIIICVHLSKMKNFMFLKPSQTLYFRFIIGRTPPNPSDFRFIMKKSLYNRFYTKTLFQAHFYVFPGHHTVFLTN